MFQKTLKEYYPLAFQELSSGRVMDPPLTKEIYFLSEQNWKSIQHIIKSFYQLKEDVSYQQLVSQKSPDIAKQHNQHNSPLMAYDFHIQDNSVKLIEINTNASAFLLAYLLYQSFDKKNNSTNTSHPFQKDSSLCNITTKQSLLALQQAFLTEWTLFNPNKKTPKIVLIDQDIEKQKMRFEFFMYQDFFKSMGWDLEILDSKSLSLDSKSYLYTEKQEKIDFIYNRTTDFYFKSHPKLSEAYLKKTCLILPQPRDYALLSDKNRLLNWKQLPQLKKIQEFLLETHPFNESTKEELWKNRKKYFFKIQQGYGGQLAYRGSSLTRKKAQLLLNYKSLAQEYCPASILTDAQGQKWKLDLRVYVYKNQIQQLIARIYQGQVTNFKMKGSGFARVKIKS